MEKAILKAEVRTLTGKKAAKDLRNLGDIPANVYKSGKPAVSLKLSIRSLEEIIHTKAGENVIITLKITGDDKVKDKTVLIKEIQREPIKDGILHVDFSEISLTDMLKVNVPLVSHGDPVGVKVDGGLLEHVIRELHVECLPTAIPEKIMVEVSALKVGDAIFVKNIVIPEGVKVLNDPELIAMIVKPPKVEVAKEEGVEGASAEPELIRKKKEEDAEEGAAPAAPAKEAEKAAPAPKKEAK